MTPTCHPERAHYGRLMCKPCYMRGWRATHREEIRARRRLTYSPRHHRDQRLRSHFGLTRAEYIWRLAEQEGKCAVCRGEPGGRWGTLCVDHDHATGQVRGLLCLRCNRAIGLVRDDPSLLQALAGYLSPKVLE